jgi:hypothetical protein
MGGVDLEGGSFVDLMDAIGERGAAGESSRGASCRKVGVASRRG